MMVKRFMATQSMSYIRSKRGRAEASYGLHAALLSMELAALITAGEYVSHTSVMQEKYCFATTNFRLGGAHDGRCYGRIRSAREGEAGTASTFAFTRLTVTRPLARWILSSGHAG